jgi:hypothetical protein
VMHGFNTFSAFQNATRIIPKKRPYSSKLQTHHGAPSF